MSNPERMAVLILWCVIVVQKCW